MHLQIGIYRRNFSDNQKSALRTNADILKNVGCCISAFLAVLFLGLALLCIFFPQGENDRKLFIIFIGLFGIFEVLCFLYCCIPCCQNGRGSSDDEEEDESSRNSLLSSEGNSYQDIPGYNGIASYQASPGYPEVPSYQQVLSYQEVPRYQAVSINQEVPNYQSTPHRARGDNFPEHAYLLPLVNKEGVFVHQQIPIHHQHLLEPQLPPYSPGYIQRSATPQKDILVY